MPLLTGRFRGGVLHHLPLKRISSRNSTTRPYNSSGFYPFILLSDIAQYLEHHALKTRPNSKIISYSPTTIFTNPTYDISSLTRTSHFVYLSWPLPILSTQRYLCYLMTILSQLNPNSIHILY
jgi:hypothetical protein